MTLTRKYICFWVGLEVGITLRAFGMSQHPRIKGGAYTCK
jgi:hypothetical protein